MVCLKLYLWLGSEKPNLSLIENADMWKLWVKPYAKFTYFNEKLNGVVRHTPIYTL